MKSLLKRLLFPIYDLVLIPFSYLYLPLLKQFRKFGVQNFPLHKKAFHRTGVFPLQDHYYEPQFTFPKSFNASSKRALHIDFRIEHQLRDLASLRYVDELNNLPKNKPKDQDPDSPSFYMDNGAFGAGDADMYYLMIRNRKPRRIIEIGSGFSTLLALEAVRKNKEEGIETKLICIEPYETSWLDKCGEIQLLRKKLEEIDLSFFLQLEENDILFIDSSHIIQPDNDVLYEYLRLLPTLNTGVFIHIHDIFSPRNYRQEWITEEVRFWNEQYLLEAFLYYNHSFSVVFALNLLKNDHYQEASFTLRNLTPAAEPGSFWLKKV